VDLDEARSLLAAVATGELSVDAGVARLADGPLGADGSGFTDLGFARLDTHRALRTGDPEVIYGAGKRPEHVVRLLRELADRSGDRPAVVTRLGDDGLAAVAEAFPTAEVDAIGRCAAVGSFPEPRGRVAVVCAGTSDLPVAHEAAFVTRACGAGADRIDDVGVAGIHRLLAERERLATADCLIVIAGMEGALPSVVGGLVGTPLVAVPTSVGYGASLGGVAALLAMLNSCAPGVVVCNIDNGFGAGIFASRVARRMARAAG
jgi:pyridinium-3,5-biscarboxylic acid mononucleotide synthase